MIMLNGHALSLEQVWQVASLQSPCELAAEARPLVRRSRELVEALAAQPRAIYGINTGFGPLSGFRVSNQELAHLANLLVGIGHAQFDHQRLSATEALRRAGLAPAVLQCKEGLALVNGTS